MNQQHDRNASAEKSSKDAAAPSKRLQPSKAEGDRDVVERELKRSENGVSKEEARINKEAGFD
jgi:hypothetical protein